MRVISGLLKGKKLEGYNVETTRPTMDRVKESMFASIQEDIPNSIVLDLFCGTGSLGIEALSQGADHCYFVDNNREILKYLNKNINNLNIKDKSTVLNKDYKSALQEAVQTTKTPVDYELLEATGPSHDKRFKVAVKIDGITYATGIGKSKKQAEQEAAKKTMGMLADK